MKDFPMQLLGELVAVLPEPAAKTKVILPDWQKSLFGRVLAFGPEAKDVKIGDKVNFGAATGMESVLDGAAIRIMRESEIDFIL
jgi:co-chaperonin GroES (HSP10)